jgi:hypothetical protein
VAQFQTVATFVGNETRGELIAVLPFENVPKARMQFRLRLDPFTNNNGAKDGIGVYGHNDPRRKGMDVLLLTEPRMVFEANDI